MLQVRNISVDLGEFDLRDVTLTVEAGQYMCLAGPTGAGKTVLLECIAGLHRPKTGRILLNDCDVTHLPPESRGIGYVPQDYALFPHVDVLGNITYGLVERAMPKGSARSRAESAAAILQISHLLHRDVTTLSGGERQRVALARTFVLDCQLLLLDEPLSALDSATSKEFAIHLAEIHRQLNLAVLHVTHDFTEAFSLATHIAVCTDGRLLHTGTVRDVFTKPNCRTVASFLGIANVFPRRGEDRSGCPIVSRLACSPPPDSCVCISPDQITLSRNHPHGGDLVVEATVRDVRWLGPIHEVILDIGTPLIATLSRQEQQALDLQAGDTLRACIGKRAIHVLDDR